MYISLTFEIKNEKLLVIFYINYIILEYDECISLTFEIKND
jgi:hypothetical protein